RYEPRKSPPFRAPSTACGRLVSTLDTPVNRLCRSPEKLERGNNSRPSKRRNESESRPPCPNTSSSLLPPVPMENSAEARLPLDSRALIVTVSSSHWPDRLVAKISSISVLSRKRQRSM